jgi:hypothetical protein
LLLDNALATMGAGLPSAIMAAMLHPDRRVLAVCGDGGFMMTSQELKTAARVGLNLVVLILWKQAADGFPDFGMTFGNPQFAAYARAYGLKGAQVENASDLVPMLENAFAERTRCCGTHRLCGEQPSPDKRAAGACGKSQRISSREDRTSVAPGLTAPPVRRDTAAHQLTGQVRKPKGLVPRPVFQLRRCNLRSSRSRKRHLQ